MFVTENEGGYPFQKILVVNHVQTPYTIKYVEFTLWGRKGRRKIFKSEPL